MSLVNPNISQKNERFQLYSTSILSQDLVLKQNYTNIFELPVLEKIVLNTTSSAYATDKKNLVPALFSVELITGQKAHWTVAKKSLAPFKIRENQILGCKVTLRGKNLYNFLDILMTVVLPKVRDFSGISQNSLNRAGHLSLGFVYLLLFPQIENHFEYFQNFRGLNVNFVVKTGSHKVDDVFYSSYQIPFKKK